MTLDSTFRPLANSLISQFGATATLRRVARVYDEDTRRTTDTNTDSTIKISPPTVNNGRQAGTLITEANFTCLAAATSLLDIDADPEKDKIVFKGTTYDLVRSDRVYSGELVAAYRLYLRA
jgi:hypothetical protein